MADIFISYSKADRLAVEALASLLEAEGWSVWWDKSLSAGDAYRDQIIKELAQARAVVVVWTPNSISSDWVRAEAGQAKANGKLIPVKSDGIGYGDIPLPFGEMHTEPLGNAAQIRAAVVAQLARPQSAPTGLGIAKAELRYALLSWAGIIGGAITIFSSLDGVVRLAAWVQAIVQRWIDWTHAIWSYLFDWLGIPIVHAISSTLSFLVFFGSIVAGTSRSMKADRNRTPYALAASSPNLQHHSFVKLLFIALGALLLPVVLLLAWILAYGWLERPFLTGPRPAMLAGIAVLWFSPGLFWLYFCRDRLDALKSIAFIALASIPFLFASFEVRDEDMDNLLATIEAANFSRLAISLALVFAVPIALSVVPARLLNRRLLFVFVGVCLALVLNEIALQHPERYLIDLMPR